MTPSELKANVEPVLPHFFDHKTMKFFGDRMSNYGVRSVEFNGVQAWELYRKHAVKHGLTSSTYFDKTTFKRVSRFINQ